MLTVEYVAYGVCNSVDNITALARYCIPFALEFGCRSLMLGNWLDEQANRVSSYGFNSVKLSNDQVCKISGIMDVIELYESTDRRCFGSMRIPESPQNM